jgi:hypothetical protein
MDPSLGMAGAGADMTKTNPKMKGNTKRPKEFGRHATGRPWLGAVGGAFFHYHLIGNTRIRPKYVDANPDWQGAIRYYFNNLPVPMGLYHRSLV